MLSKTYVFEVLPIFPYEIRKLLYGIFLLSSMDEQEKMHLENTVEELGKYRGRHTELVTVYVPAGYNLNLIVKQIDSEKSTASNIKSKNTRKAVLDSLERISRQLKLYKANPKNGLVLFSGNVSEQEGQEQIEIWAIEPPMPLRTKLYRCDQVFVLDPLKEMLEIKEVYGLIVVERKEAAIGILEGKNIRVLQKLTSNVPGKFKTGGQSSLRFSRIREQMAREFYRRLAEDVKKHFFDMKKLKGILLGGPGPTKEDFLKEGELVTALKEKIMAVKDIGYSDEFGLKLLVEASADVLSQQAFTIERTLLERFFSLLATQYRKVAYGKDEVKKALEMGAAEEILISTKVKKEEIKEFEELAISTSTKVHYVSDETEQGLQFKNLGGFGAFLRFSIE